MHSFIRHHGIPGQKWGVRRYQNKDGTRTAVGRRIRTNPEYKKDDTVFISGKVKFDTKIPKTVEDEINRIISKGSNIIIGDAPGADTRVQDYLNNVGYKKVTVYTTDSKPRNNVGNWKVKKISKKGFSNEREQRAQKDIAMTKAATRGLAISSMDDRPDSATSKNITRLSDSGSLVRLYDYKTGRWVNR